MKKVIDSKPKTPSPKDQQMILGYRRYRLLYFFLVIVTIAMGIASRELSPFLPDWISLYAGDVLWAALVFFLVAFLFAKMPTYAVAPWIDGLRATALGHLVLGDTFVVSDLFCYAGGICLGVVVDLLLKGARRPY